ncbi:MAG TPA: FkbM family methyltransferase [Candidatus Paceibacterota bacterium]|nr:FkbM family methyltransferase [Candidatus Paceibacterota bacterium]
MNSDRAESIWQRAKRTYKEYGFWLLIKRILDLYYFPTYRHYFPEKNVTTTLFGKPFIGTPSLTKGLVNEVILCDQYHVGLAHGTIVDAGANIGAFSIFAAVTHPESTIYSFEPTPSTFEMLKENTKHYPNIKIFNCGLGERNMSASIVKVPENCGQNHIGDGGEPCEIKTIDSFDIPMDFLKIDSEGYEANILRGATETIKKHRPIVAMSAYHKPEDKTELPNVLNSIASYDCVLSFSGEEDLICKPL